MKYLKFIWKGELYKYTCFSDRLAQCPRWFLNLTKPIYAYLHSLCHIVIGLDDSLIMADTESQYLKAIAADTITLFVKMGFVVHPKKSVLVPKLLSTEW